MKNILKFHFVAMGIAFAMATTYATKYKKLPSSGELKKLEKLISPP